MTLQTGQALSKDSQTLRDTEGRQFVIDADGIGATVMASQATLNPGAGLSLAGIATPPGVWRISGGVMISGTAETLLLNFRLRLNGVLLMALPSGQLGVWVPFEIPRLVVTAGSLDIHTAIAAAVGTAVYNAILIGTRVE